MTITEYMKKFIQKNKLELEPISERYSKIYQKVKPFLHCYNLTPKNAEFIEKDREALYYNPKANYDPGTYYTLETVQEHRYLDRNWIFLFWGNPNLFYPFEEKVELDFSLFCKFYKINFSNPYLSFKYKGEKNGKN